MVGYSPRVRRERLAAELKALRVEAGLSTTQLAALIGKAQSTITRLETLKALPDRAMVWNILDVLHVEEPRKSEMLRLARDAAERGWWRAFEGMPAAQRGRAELEGGAVTIREYTPVYMPGLLQSPAYARARFEDGDAFEPFDIEEAVRGRAKRQEVLTRTDHPADYEVVIDEAVFLRPTAEPAALREQLEHLLTMASLPNVTVRVLPMKAVTQHRGWPVNGFSIYTYADPADPIIVGVETESSDLHLGDADDVRRYQVMYERSRQAAFAPEVSVHYIEGALDDQLR